MKLELKNDFFFACVERLRLEALVISFWNEIK